MQNKIANAHKVKILGDTEDLDSADVWARAVCLSLFGSQGEYEYRKLSALPVLLTYRYLIDTGTFH